MAFSPSSRERLTDYDLDRFPDDTLFHQLARADRIWTKSIPADVTPKNRLLIGEPCELPRR
jgi:hypothetical protein